MRFRNRLMCAGIVGTFVAIVSLGWATPGLAAETADLRIFFSSTVEGRVFIDGAPLGLITGSPDQPYLVEELAVGKHQIHVNFSDPDVRNYAGSVSVVAGQINAIEIPTVYLRTPGVEKEESSAEPAPSLDGWSLGGEVGGLVLPGARLFAGYWYRFVGARLHLGAETGRVEVENNETVDVRGLTTGGQVLWGAQINRFRPYVAVGLDYTQLAENAPEKTKALELTSALGLDIVVTEHFYLGFELASVDWTAAGEFEDPDGFVFDVTSGLSTRVLSTFSAAYKF